MKKNRRHERSCSACKSSSCRDGSTSAGPSERGKLKRLSAIALTDAVGSENIVDGSFVRGHIQDENLDFSLDRREMNEAIADLLNLSKRKRV